jgi:hypothetical protein
MAETHASGVLLLRKPERFRIRNILSAQKSIVRQLSSDMEAGDKITMIE